MLVDEGLDGNNSKLELSRQTLETKCIELMIKTKYIRSGFDDDDVIKSDKHTILIIKSLMYFKSII